MRREFENVVALGPLPGDDDLDEAKARSYVEALDQLVESPTGEEASALVDLFPPDASTSRAFGVVRVFLTDVEHHTRLVAEHLGIVAGRDPAEQLGAVGGELGTAGVVLCCAAGQRA